MRAFRFFLEQLGIIFLATICHELYHASHGVIEVIGVQFGVHGGFFVQGTDRDNEVVAYCITLAVWVLCETCILLPANRRK